MLVYRHKGGFLKASSILAWWPQSLGDVHSLFGQASVVVLWQCPAALVPDLRPWIFRERRFSTHLIDLTR